MRLLPIIYSLLFCLSIVEGYRILGVFTFNAKSHFVMFEALMKGLARRGHQVDVISTFPQKTPYPNYTDVVKLKAPMQFVNSMTYEFMTNVIGRTNPTYSIATIAGGELCKYLALPEMQKLIRNPPNDPPYDLVIMEVFGAQCYAIIGHLWNVPTVAISSTSLYPWLHKIIAHPENLAYVPNNCIGFMENMNFWQRLYNTLNTQYLKWYFAYYTRNQNDILKEHFGADTPSVQELQSKIAMILINSHISLNGIKSTIPAAIEVGGLHILHDESPHQPELEKWMNESKHGFVYFTFGSMVMIETFPPEILDTLYTSLGKITPVRVLMKVPKPDKLPANLPENIYTFSWMSQLKVLRHPNIKAFLTHGGLMGVQEAVACGVPLIGIPLFADQFSNMDMLVARNAAVKVDIHTMTEENLDAALNAVLWDRTYRESIQNLSRQFLDRPTNSLDTAIYWVEYIIKYGSNSLRSPAMDLTWWQLEHIDIIIFLVLCVIIVIIVVSCVAHRISMDTASLRYGLTIQRATSVHLKFWRRLWPTKVTRSM